MSTILSFVVGALSSMPARERRAVAMAAGVPFSTVQKITFRTSTNPGVNAVEALYRTLLFREGLAPPVIVANALNATSVRGRTPQAHSEG
jgi:hypothetical protein